jgi:hypothetical protein
MTSISEMKGIYNFLMTSNYIQSFIFDKYSISNIFTKISNIMFQLDKSDVVNTSSFDEDDSYIFNNLGKILRDLQKEFMEYIVEKKVFDFMDKRNINHETIKKISVSFNKKGAVCTCGSKKCKEKDSSTSLPTNVDLTEIFKLIKTGDYENVKFFIGKNPNAVNYFSKLYVSPLELCCDFYFHNMSEMNKIEIYELAKNRLNIVRLLLANGAIISDNVVSTALDREKEPNYIKTIKDEIIFVLSLYRQSKDPI